MNSQVRREGEGEARRQGKGSRTLDRAAGAHQHLAQPLAIALFKASLATSYVKHFAPVPKSVWAASLNRASSDTCGSKLLNTIYIIFQTR